MDARWIINGDGGCRLWQPVQADSQPKSSGLVLGRRPLGDVLHSSNEPGELSQWLCRDNSTLNIVLDIITVWTVVQTVLTATLNSYGNRQISTPTRSIPLSWSTKKVGTVDYVHERTPYTKFGTNQPTEGFWANGWNTKNYFLFIPFFSGSRTGQTRRWIFTRDSSKDMKSRKDVPFGVWTMSP